MSIRSRWRSAPAGRTRQLPIDLRVRPWYNPDLRTSRFIIPGLIAIILTFTLIQFTASAIVRERERGTLEQLQVTPATRAELILGKILPFIVIGYFQFTLAIAADALPVPHRRSPAPCSQLYLVGFLFMAAVLGLGMLHLDDRPDADAGHADVDVLPAAVRVPLRLRLPDRRHAD